MRKLVVAALAAAVSVGAVAGISSAQEKKGEKKKGQDRAAIFKRLDKNNDEKLSKEEFLAPRKTDEAKEKAGQQFARLDADKDGFLSKEEFTKPAGGKKGKKKDE